jgi:hypothetical protein
MATASVADSILGRRRLAAIRSRESRLTKAASAANPVASWVVGHAVWVGQAASAAAAGLPARVAAGLGAALPVLRPPLEAAARASPLPL